MGLTTSIRQVRYWVKRDWALSRFAAEEDPTIRAIAIALQRTLAGEANPLERVWIERLELHRRELESSNEKITRLDHGAGSPAEHRSPAEMAAGVLVEDSLGRICRLASKGPSWCTLLFRLVRGLRPDACIELGSCVGVSASYLAAALHLNGKGSLITLEGAESLADKARETLYRHGLTNAEVVTGRFQETFGPSLSRLAPVDFLFIDGHHEEQATLTYFDQARSFTSDRSLFVFDDIQWSDGMGRAWAAISTDQSVDLALDLGPMGLCLVNRRGGRHRTAKIPL
ncbi:MAG TPA: class I SAM-dependent methyltransferase [Gemmatimonadales bacterium]